MRRLKPFAILFLLALFVAGIAACGEPPQEVHVERLIQIDYKGIDGYAEPQLSLDEDYILSLIDPDGELEDLGQIEVLQGREKDKYARKLRFFDTLKYHFDEPYEHVKNGDGLTVIVSQDEAVSEDSNFYLDRREFDRKVTGLPKGEPVDFSKAYILETEGFDGRGTAKLNESEAFRKELKLPFELSLDKDEKLHNDDTVTVTVTYDPEVFGEAGYIVPEAKLQHTVTGLMPLTLLDADLLWQGIQIEFSGFAPYLKPELDNSLPDLYRDLFTLTVEDEQEFYKIGDTLKLKLTFDQDKLDDLKAVGYDCDEKCFKKDIEIEKEDVDYYLDDVKDLKIEDLELEDIRDEDGEVLVKADTVPNRAVWLVLQPEEGEEDAPAVPYNVLLLVYEIEDDDKIALAELSDFVSEDGDVFDRRTRATEIADDITLKSAVKKRTEQYQDQADYEVTDVTDDLYPSDK